MKGSSHDPLALDVLAFSRTEASLQGRWPLAGMQRLTEGLCAATDADASWQARGWQLPVAGGEPEVWLELQASAEVPLQCQRCLQPMNERLEVLRRFRFVRSEDEAARLDEESEDDVLAVPARLDLHALLEDELILSLPIVPRHEVCPAPLALADDVAADEPPHPFAALAGLRVRSSGGG